ncbi:DUF3027 domain-containing protein [Agromyces aureus]|uniref:Uncharacterized protein n=1 Tax=Agromyces aureus TaxID=453304 RepID=A0A191WDU8_9MICO|nr:DUF3027 domain-containing protein [Agromyces aureus]ANJ26397.1 hypothetical protein ATC03_06355 [Agromyces aureus]
MPEFTEPETDAAESVSEPVAPVDVVEAETAPDLVPASDDEQAGGEQAGDEQADAEQADDVEPEAEPVIFEPDPVLLASVDLARRALLETTAPETVGSVIGHIAEDEHVLTLHFASDMSGYPGWHWSVTLVRVDDDDPTILETQLMPGERALLAPAWVPWSERLADYRAAQAVAVAAARAAGEEPEADELDDVEFDDASEELEIDADDEYEDDDHIEEDDHLDDDEHDDHLDDDEHDDHLDEDASEAFDESDDDESDDDEESGDTDDDQREAPAL